MSTTSPSTAPTVPTVVSPTTAFLDHRHSGWVHLGTTLRDWRRCSPCGGTRNRRHHSIPTESRPGGKGCGSKGLHRRTSDRAMIPTRRCHGSTLLVGIGCLGRACSHSCSETSHPAGGPPTIWRHSWLERFVVHSTRKVPISPISCYFDEHLDRKVTSS
jgi:hypothetical protein